MNKYRFSGVTQKITFNSGKSEVEFVPDAECVVRYHKDKDTDVKFFILTSDDDECIGRKFEKTLTLKVLDGKLGVFSVGVHIVMDLEETEESKADVIFDVKLSKKYFRLASLEK